MLVMALYIFYDLNKTKYMQMHAKKDFFNAYYSGKTFISEFKIGRPKRERHRAFRLEVAVAVIPMFKLR